MSDNDSIYYDTYVEGSDPPPRSVVSRVLHIVLTTAGCVLIASILFILIYRMIEMREPSGVGDLVTTQKLSDAYRAAGETEVKDAYADPALYAFERETLREVTLTKKGATKEEYEKIVLPASEYYVTRGAKAFEAGIGSYEVEVNGKKDTVKISGYYEVKDSPVEGAMRVNHVYLFPYARHVQLTFRYKSDALSRLNGQKNASGGEFTFRLFDDKGELYDRYGFTSVVSRGVYRYVTLVFEDVALDDVSRLTLAVRYLDGAGKTAELDIPFYDEEIPLPLLSCDVTPGEVDDRLKTPELTGGTYDS